MAVPKLSIDGNLCTGCGACVQVCPVDCLSLEEGLARVTGDHCIHCAHCRAVCPVAAIEVEVLDPRAWAFGCVDLPQEALPFGGGNLTELLRIMTSRRSCRAYTAETVDRGLLEDLVRVGTTAATGTNSQRWTFTVLPRRKEVLHLGEAVAAFYDRLNALASKGWLREGLALLGKDELRGYHRRLQPTIEAGLAKWRSGGEDLLFRGATAVILVGHQPGGSTPVDDSLLAVGNMMLAAHGMGLGSCLIGFASLAMARDRSIQRAIGIPPEEKVDAVLALGHPAVTFHRITGRRFVKPRFFELPEA